MLGNGKSSQSSAHETLLSHNSLYILVFHLSKYLNIDSQSFSSARLFPMFKWSSPKRLNEKTPALRRRIGVYRLSACRWVNIAHKTPITSRYSPYFTWGNLFVLQSLVRGSRKQNTTIRIRRAHPLVKHRYCDTRSTIGATAFHC